MPFGLPVLEMDFRTDSGVVSLDKLHKLLAVKFSAGIHSQLRGRSSRLKPHVDYTLDRIFSGTRGSNTGNMKTCGPINHVIHMKRLPWALDQRKPSMEILSLKSRSSLSELGLACFGSAVASHVEHFSSAAAFTTSGRKPCWRKMVANFSADGCPRLRWALRMAACSDLGICWNERSCCLFCKSASWDLDKVSSGDVVGLASGGNESTEGSFSSTFGISAGSAGTALGLAANTVILIRLAGAGRVSWRWDICSQLSHSLSMEILSSFLSR